MTGVVGATIVVEGRLDEVVMQRLAIELGFDIWRILGRRGKAFIRERVRDYAAAARGSPWIVVCDLDDDAPCAAALVRNWLGDAPVPKAFILRICVRAIEAWLLADGSALAKFLNVQQRRIPTDVDAIPDPKRFLVDLARTSKSARVRDAICPTVRSGRRVGPGYDVMLTEFVRDRWDMAIAAKRSDSFARCLRSLTRIGSK